MLSSSKANTDLEIPMWSKPISSTSSRKKSTGDVNSLEIPLWTKPTCPNNMENYVSVVPLHQSEATKYLAAQRNQPVASWRWSPRSSSWCPHGSQAKVGAELMAENASIGTAAESTSAEDNSDELTFVDASTVAEDNCSENNGPEPSVSGEDTSAVTGEADANTTKALVTALRDARLRVSNRRTGLTECNAGASGEPQTARTAGSEVKDLVADLRAARLTAAARRLGGIAKGSIDAPFAVTVIALNGKSYEIKRVHSHMLVSEFCELVAKEVAIPNFAVRLMLSGSDETLLLHISHEPMSLLMAGISEGSELTLVKDFGAGKPDLVRLAEMEKQWRGGSQAAA